MKITLSYFVIADILELILQILLHPGEMDWDSMLLYMLIGKVTSLCIHCPLLVFYEKTYERRNTFNLFTDTLQIYIVHSKTTMEESTLAINSVSKGFSWFSLVNNITE